MPMKASANIVAAGDDVEHRAPGVERAPRLGGRGSGADEGLLDLRVMGMRSSGFGAGDCGRGAPR